MKIRVIVLIAVMIAGIVIGLFISGFFNRKDSRVVEQDSTILLEKVKKVTKLVTVEGYFSELYSYKDYYKFDFWPFRKKALLRVKARVTAGIDLNELTFEADEDQRQIILKGDFEPQILYIETDFDYYDLTEGTFNTFSEKDHTELQKKAKSFIRQSAIQSDLLLEADEQFQDVIQTLQFIVESSGWKLIIEKPGYEPLVD